MPEEKDNEMRLALDRLRQMRVQLQKDNRLSSLLVRPLVLHRLRQTERVMEQSLEPMGSTRTFTYTAKASSRDGTSGYEALKSLTAQSQAALQSRDAVTASHLASELLARNTDRASWNYGNVVHEANQILGLAALQQGDTQAAREYLLAAGRTPGSPQLDSFGPTMTLAQSLLRQGEREVVLTYLDDVARFWASRSKSGRSPVNFLLGSILAARNTRSIKSWKDAIRRGETPALNRIVQGSSG